MLFPKPACRTLTKDDVAQTRPRLARRVRRPTRISSSQPSLGSTQTLRVSSFLMPDLRTYALLSTGVVVSWATYLSIKNNSYLDTSNPLLTALPHPLHATHYFASKKNILNIFFIKKAWGWTTAAFFTLYFLSTPKSITPSSSGNNSWTFRRLLQYALATACWLFFSAWFFGPPVLDRLITASGGECVLHLPGPHGAYIPVPPQYCTDRIRISPATHPELFPSPLITAADLLSKTGTHAELSLIHI